MFLSDLIDRALGQALVVEPRRASRFEGPGEQPAADLVFESSPEPQPGFETAPAREHGVPGGRLPVREHIERVESRIVERLQPAPAPPMPPAAATPRVDADGTPREIAVPVAEPSNPPPLPVLPPPQQIAAVERAPAFTAEGEAVIRERTETRVEERTVERRLEQLVRELKTVERVERMEPAPAPMTAGRDRTAAPAAEPRASAPVFPEVRFAPQPARPPRAPFFEREVPRTAESVPVVHVTIGRVEVRATAPDPARTTPAHRREPKLGLEEYLRQRERA